MNDFNSEPLSTEITDTAPIPAGSADFVPDASVREEAPKDKPMSLDDAMKKAVEDTKAEPDAKKAEPKPKADKPSPERGEGGKFAPKAKPEAEPQAEAQENKEPPGNPSAEDGGEGEREQTEARPSEGRDPNRAPAHFLPRAKEKWGTVDADVRGEVHRMMDNYEKGLEEGREAMEFRKGLRQFEDMAKQAGTTVSAALENYVRIDQELRNNPENALKNILQSINLTPEQYAQHVLGQKQQTQNPQAAQTQQLQGQIQQLQQQIQQLTQGTREQQEAARLAEVQRSIIEPFKAEHPRYQELEPDIAFFLNRGKVPSNLPERQRLEVAYDMAERINPAGYAPEPVNPAQNAQRPINPAGSKSVKGSPSYGASVPKGNTKLSLEESIRRAVGENRF